MKQRIANSYAAARILSWCLLLNVTVSVAHAVQAVKETPRAPRDCGVYIEWTGAWFESVFVTWKDGSTNEDGFEIEHWQQNTSGEWQRLSGWIAPMNATVSLYTFSWIYGYHGRYRVRAFNMNGYSDWSNWAYTSRRDRKR